MSFAAPAPHWRHLLDGARTRTEPHLWPALGIALLAGLLARLPLNVLALSLAAAAVLVAAIREPAAACGLLALALPFGRYVPLPFAGADAVDLLVLGVVAAWLFSAIRHHALRVRLRGAAIPAIILLWVLALSLTQAASWREGLREWLKWAELVALFVAALQILPGKQHLLLIGLFLAGVSEVALGAYQFLFRAGPEAFVWSGRFMRAYGTFSQPNPYAGYLGYLAPVAASLFLAYGVRAWKQRNVRTGAIALLLASVAAALVAGMLMSGSRGAWIGLVVALALVGALHLRPATAIVTIGTMLLLAATVWLAGGTLVPEVVGQRLADLSPAAASVDMARTEITDANFAVMERVAHWQAALRMWNDHPLLGVGIGNYATAYAQYAGPYFYDALGHAHNVYLNFLAETGLLGLAAFLGFWLSAIWSLSRIARRTLGIYRGLAIGIIGSIAYLTVHSLFDNLFVAHMQLQLALLLAAAASIPIEAAIGTT